MNTNSPIDSATRTASARSMLRERPRSRIRKYSADVRLAMIRMNAMTMIHFTNGSGESAMSGEERIVVRGGG